MTSQAGCFVGVLAVLAAILSGGCTSTPLAKEHLYVLSLSSVQEVPKYNTRGPDLVVRRFGGEGFARGSTMWARISPIEVEPWVNHKWARPIPELVTTAILEWGASSGRFKSVAGAADADFQGVVLGGVVKAFEEIDQGDKKYALVRLQVHLTRSGAQGTKRLWLKTIEEKVPARSGHPEDLVYAFGEALEKILDWAVRAGEEAR